MKTLHFGFENSSRPTGGFDGRGFGLKEGEKNVGPIAGSLVGIYNINGENYLIYKVIDAFGKGAEEQKYIGKYELRRAVADIYSDGSAILYVDQTKGNTERKFETLLNDNSFKSKISKGWDISSLLEQLGIRPSYDFAFECALKPNNKSTHALVTAIRHEVFEEKKRLIHSVGSKSISSLQEELENLIRIHSEDSKLIK